MDWITLLRSLQSDFIRRLSSGCLLHCQKEGDYSELTIISGERLRTLRDFCWQMAEKYKRNYQVRDVFINNLKGKLGEEVVKERLADFITEIDYEKRYGGDGNMDFTLTSQPEIGVEVKSRHGTIDKVRWSVSSDEVAKNAVVVCILIQEEVNEAQTEYHLFFAGFLPTQMIKLKTGKISFGIGQLLYGGGLRYYLEQLQLSTINYTPPQISQFAIPKNQKLSNIAQSNGHVMKSSLRAIADINYPDMEQAKVFFAQGNYDTAIDIYNRLLNHQPNNTELYYQRGLARYEIGDYEGAIADYNQVIQINPHHSQAYKKSGLTRYKLADYQGAIADYTQAIQINPDDSAAYINRGYTRSCIGDKQGAIEDYTQAVRINPHHRQGKHHQPEIDILLQEIEVNPHDADTYKHRGDTRCDLGDYQGAIADYTQAIQINSQDAHAYYNRGHIHYDLGNYESAIADYTQVINIHPQDADAYYSRGNSRYQLGDNQGSMEDFQKSTDIYRQQGKLKEHKNARQRILDLEIEASLDILNF
ncbi:tetratricopeptide repeat protein [Calothrix rhizosoleniae]|uniref:tetratricopeptide repeat protein n=1 Tax=Calothrix rhizosoleniae TaxID=888997 RepID=UPI000B4A3868|nr:tetratricopeptide repeat protein [Calothrix rhizosoleniae]